VTAALRSCK